MLSRCRRKVLACDLGQPRNRRSRGLRGYLTRDGVAPAELAAIGRVKDHFRVCLGAAQEESAGVFVAGDASRDAQFAIVAAAEGLRAAVAINKTLQRQELQL